MPTIDFVTYNEETLVDFKPVLAKDVLPEWWKKQKIHEVNIGQVGHTIQACPAMDDWLKIGWYIIANKDHEIVCGDGAGHDEDDFTFSTHSVDASPSHPANQFGPFEFLNDKPIKDAFKFRMPWNIILPKGYSMFYTDPFLFQNRHFAVWPGIIDGDTFNKNMDNAQLILYPRTTTSFVIKKGTPICQIIPFRREEWVASYQIRETEGFFTNMSGKTSAHGDDPLNRTMAESEPLLDRDNVRFKSGGYRQNGMWKPKSKYFSEVSPPPECPFHNKEDDSPEKQLELDV